MKVGNATTSSFLLQLLLATEYPGFQIILSFVSAIAMVPEKLKKMLTELLLGIYRTKQIGDFLFLALSFSNRFTINRVTATFLKFMLFFRRTKGRKTWLRPRGRWRPI